MSTIELLADNLNVPFLKTGMNPSCEGWEFWYHMVRCFEQEHGITLTPTKFKAWREAEGNEIDEEGIQIILTPTKFKTRSETEGNQKDEENDGNDSGESGEEDMEEEEDEEDEEDDEDIDDSPERRWDQQKSWLREYLYERKKWRDYGTPPPCTAERLLALGLWSFRQYFGLYDASISDVVAWVCLSFAFYKEIPLQKVIDKLYHVLYREAANPLSSFRLRKLKVAVTYPKSPHHELFEVRPGHDLFDLLYSRHQFRYFLRLPIGLRKKIYELTWSIRAFKTPPNKQGPVIRPCEDKTFVLKDGGWSQTVNAASLQSLSLVSKQMHREVTPHFYNIHTFEFDNVFTLWQFVSGIKLERRTYLRRVSFQYCNYRAGSVTKDKRFARRAFELLLMAQARARSLREIRIWIDEDALFERNKSYVTPEDFPGFETLRELHGLRSVVFCGPAYSQTEKYLKQEMLRPIACCFWD